jgi:hypothetical protein
MIIGFIDGREEHLKKPKNLKKKQNNKIQPKKARGAFPWKNPMAWFYLLDGR